MCVDLGCGYEWCGLVCSRSCSLAMWGHRAGSVMEGLGCMDMTNISKTAMGRVLGLQGFNTSCGV